jgi:hypothetical protein
VVGTLLVVHALHVAGSGVTMVGGWLQCPVAVNWTGEPLAVAVAGLMLSVCSSRLPVPHPAIARAATGRSHASLSGNLLTVFPLQPPL